MTTTLFKSLRTSLMCGVAALLAVSAFVTSCSNDDKTVTPELSIPATLTIGKAGGNVELPVACNVEWLITDEATDKTWYTITPKNGNGNVTVSVTATANTSSESRSVTIRVTAGTMSKTVTVTQDAADKSLTATPETLSFVAAGENKPLAITSNIAFTLISSETWCKLSTTNGSNNASITVTADPNANAAVRTATITISGTGIGDRTVSVSQAAAPGTLSLSVASLEFSANKVAKDGKNTVTVTSNGAWDVVGDSANPWCNITKSGNTITVEVTTENTGTTNRTATITVKTADNADTKTFTVVQKAEVPQSLLTETWESGEAGSTAGINSWACVAGNEPSQSFKWYTGAVTGNKYALADASNGASGTEFEYWIISPALNLDQASPKSFAFHSMVGKYVAGSSLKVYLLNSKEPNKTTELTSLARIAAHTDTLSGGESGWIPSGDISLAAHSGVKFIGFCYTAKGTGGVAGVKSTYYRVDNFTFGTESVKLLDVSPSTLGSFIASGESKTLAINSNTSWSISTPTGWTASPSSGSNSGTVTITAANNTGSSRSGNIAISGTGVSSKTIAVSQEGSSILAKWDFNDSGLSSNFSGVIINPGQLTSTDGSNSILSMSLENSRVFKGLNHAASGGNYLQADAWAQTDAMWNFEIKTTTGYTGGNIKVTFSVYGNGSSPKEWKIQWSTDNSTWNDATSGTYDITASNTKTDFVKTFAVSGITASNRLYLRFVPRSTVSIGGSTITDMGTSSLRGGGVTIEKVL